MRTKIEDHTKQEVPYTELTISPDEDDGVLFYITFRKYPKRVFVGVEDYSDDEWSNGFDGLEDVYLSPVYIIEKTLIPEFNPKQAYIKALVFAGAEYLADEYEKLGPVVQEWLNG